MSSRMFGGRGYATIADVRQSTFFQGITTLGTLAATTIVVSLAAFPIVDFWVHGRFLRPEVDAVSQDVSMLKSDVSTLKADVAEILRRLPNK